MTGRTDRLEHTYRLRCRECDGLRFAELGGEKQERAENDEPVALPCGRCKAETSHEAVAP